MELTITGRHVDITDPIRTHVEDKTAKLPRYFDRLSMLEAVISKVDDRTYRVELIAHVDGNEHLVSHGDDADVYHGIEVSVKKMERQLTDLKDKLRSH